MVHAFPLDLTEPARWMAGAHEEELLGEVVFPGVG
jgi:hypothetical protein